MEDFIVGEATSIFNKAIKRFSNDAKKDPLDVSFILRLNGERECEYLLCHDYAPVRPTTINEVLNVKFFDTKGYTVLLPPQIKKILEKCESQVGSPIEIGVYIDREEDDEIKYYLFQDGKILKEVFLLDLIK